MTLGRVPPYSIEAEEQLLSACLLDGSDVISKCIESKVAPTDFFVPANRVAYEKLTELYNSGRSTDVSVLSEELKTSKQLDVIGGYAYLTRISGRVPTTAGVSYFIEKVRELALLRDMIRVCTAGVEGCYSYTGNIAELVDKVESDIFAVTQTRVQDGAEHAGACVSAAVATFKQMAKDKGAMTGLSTGLKDIDQLLWGMKGSEMIVLAGRPSCGKTSLAMNIAEAVALPLHGRKAQGNCLVFSMEMSAIELGKRLASSRARVNQKMIRAGMFSATDLSSLEKAEKEFMESKLYIDEASSPTVMQIRAKARRLHAKKPLSLIVVDYIQLIAPANHRSPREQQVAEASKGLKSLAKELNIPVMVLAQLNRDSEKSERKPRLSDLRESGAIEQDADVVMMLYRPKIEGDEFQTASNLMGLIINKNRNGEVGDVELAFSNTITRFDNYIANS